MQKCPNCGKRGLYPGRKHDPMSDTLGKTVRYAPRCRYCGYWVPYIDTTWGTKSYLGFPHLQANWRRLHLVKKEDMLPPASYDGWSSTSQILKYLRKQSNCEVIP
jgi:hypothetical protein